MRRSIIVFASLTLLFVGVGPAFASHNDVGARFAVGNPDHGPAEDASGDVGEALVPVYHVGGAFAGTGDDGEIPRLGPEEQSGLGLGDWIGFIDGVIEHPGPAFNQCLSASGIGIFGITVGLGQCGLTSDPLYRVSPAPDDTECRDLGDNADVGDPADPDDDACSGGNDHLMPLDYWPGVVVQNHKIDVVNDEDDEGSGFYYPSLHGMYIYLFGEGSGVAAGEGSFSHLDGICEAPTGHYAPGSDKDCNLITREDLDKHTSLEGQRAAVCSFGPFFVTLSGGSDDQACANISEFNQFFDDSQSSTYVANKPGWYLQTGWINPFAGLLSTGTVPMMDGNRTDVAVGGLFHYYVNPVRPASNLWCAFPPIATDAGDGIDTSANLVLDEDGNWSHWERGDATYLVEAHEFDVYFANEQTDGAAGTALDLVNEVLDQIPALPPEVQEAIDDVEDTIDELGDDANDATGPILDALDESVDRVAVNVGQSEEPNRPGDNSWSLSAASPATRCSSANGLTEGEGFTTFYNRNQATLDSQVVDSIPGGTLGVNFPGLGGDALHDYTYTDEDGLPGGASEQGFNPWHADQWTFGGSLLVVDDLDDDQNFDGCPPGDDPPSASQDRCAARMPFDVYNPDAIRETDTGQTIGDFSRGQGFGDPTGLYAVLKVTGPTIVLPADPPGQAEDVEAFADNTHVFDGDGQHCVLFTSIGLLDLGDLGQGERFRTLIGLEDDTADRATVRDHLCGDVTGSTLLIDDGFDDAPGAGGYSLDFDWIPLEPKPEALEDDDDGLSVHYLVTVGPDGDDKTRSNLALGSHTGDDATVAKVWANDDVTYDWVDVELFDSEPGEPED